MELKLKTADKVMCTQILGLLRVVVAVVYLDFVDLTLLKVEVDKDFLDKLGI